VPNLNVQSTPFEFGGKLPAQVNVDVKKESPVRNIFNKRRSGSRPREFKPDNYETLAMRVVQSAAMLFNQAAHPFVPVKT